MRVLHSNSHMDGVGDPMAERYIDITEETKKTVSNIVFSGAICPLFVSY